MPAEIDIQTITVSGFPRPLLKEIDEIANRERRNRSNFIVKTIEEAVREARTAKRQKRAA